jgi:hypothetical protein
MKRAKQEKMKKEEDKTLSLHMQQNHNNAICNLDSKKAVHNVTRCTNPAG